MPYCPLCGTQNLEEHTFCHNCGTSLTGMTGQLSPHTILEGRYIVVETLGRGGMGAVYKALDQRLNNMPVAIKEMSTKAVGQGNLQAAVGAFKKEAVMLTSLEHPALPRITDFFSQGEDRWYLVMNYIEGQTLKAVVEKRGAIPEPEVLDWARQICDILDYLHNQKPPVIFRDLKPANIMLTPDGKIKLIDFGIARHFQPGYTSDTTAYGSPGYSPPEQHGESQTDARSDIYSLGVTLHQLLSGIDPAKTPFIFEPPGRHVQVSSQFEQVVMKALELKPENRPASAREVLDMLPVKPGGFNDFTGTLPLVRDDGRLAETVPVFEARQERSFNEQETFVLTNEPARGSKENYNSAPAAKNIKLVAAITSCLLIFIIGGWYGWTYYSDNQLNSNKKQSLSDSWGSTSGTSTGQSSQSNLAGTSNQNKTTDTQQIQSLLNKWVSTVKEGNISSHVTCYADYLDVYFDRNNITKDDLYKDKQIMFTQYSSIYMTIDNIQINFVNSNEASATFLKKWDARGEETFSGEETEELKLRKYNGEWKIYSEIEQNIFWVIKNGKRIM